MYVCVSFVCFCSFVSLFVLICVCMLVSGSKRNLTKEVGMIPSFAHVQ